MAFPTTGILDNFNRADENPLANGTWSGPFRESGNQFQLVTNAATPQTNAVNNSSYWSANSFGPDSEAFFDVTGGNASIDVACRINSVGANWTGYIIDTNAGTWNLYFHNSSGFTLIGGPITQVLSVGDGLGLSAVGTTITAWYRAGAGSWVSKISVTDSTVAGSGFLGISGTSNLDIIDNFGGGTVVVAGTSRLPLLGVS